MALAIHKLDAVGPHNCPVMLCPAYFSPESSNQAGSLVVGCKALLQQSNDAVRDRINTVTKKGTAEDLRDDNPTHFLGEKRIIRQAQQFLVSRSQQGMTYWKLGSHSDRHEQTRVNDR